MDVAVLEEFAERQLLSPLPYESSFSEIFHENTKLNRLNAAEYGQHLEAVINEPDLLEMLRTGHKTYSLVEERVDLPAVPPTNDLERTIQQRRSRRQYGADRLTLEQVTRLLHYSYGRTAARPFPSYLRAVPSGGALYPLEFYLVTLRVAGLTPGVYHYSPPRHALERIRSGEFLPELQNLLFVRGIDLERAAGVVVVTGVLRRNWFKYLDRGYRMVLMEAGAVGQNMALIADALGLGCVSLGGFYDDELSGFLGVDEVFEPPLLPIVVGVRPQDK